MFEYSPFGLKEFWSTCKRIPQNGSLSTAFHLKAFLILQLKLISTASISCFEFSVADSAKTGPALLSKIASIYYYYLLIQNHI